MRKYILLLLILASCKNENQYKLALDQYIEEDLHYKQARINYQLEEFKIKSVERGFGIDYKKQHDEASLLNQLCLEFESKSLNNSDLNTIRKLFKSLKDSLLKQNFRYNRSIKREIDKLPSTIEDDFQKYDLLRKLKELNYEINDLELNRVLHVSTGPSSIKPSSLLALRLDDSTVVLNIYSQIAKGYSKNFNDKSFTITKLEDNNENKITNRGQIRNIIESYIIETKSDTIFLDAILKTKKETGLLIAENKSYIIVGKHKYFDKNHLKEYFDFYINN